MREQYGVCRHQAAAAAWLLEYCTREGYATPGSVSVDANFGDNGGHAWARQELAGSEAKTSDHIFFIDPGKADLVLPLSAAAIRPDVLRYARPEDLALLEQFTQ